MILLVESNFVLELAFRQEQVANVERLIELAAQRRIELVIPGCALNCTLLTSFSSTLARIEHELAGG